MAEQKAMVEVPAEAGEMAAYLARPEGEGPHPAVVVVMEAFGLNDHIKGVADRIAAEGYVAIAPDVYYRERERVVGYDELDKAIGLMNTLADGKVLKDMEGVVSFLRAQADVRGDRIGMTGFCMGGRITFLTACNNPAISAAAPFYGGGIGSVAKPSERIPKAPLDYAESLEAPMLLFFGGNDPFIPQEEIERIRRRLADLEKRAETIVYPDAPHGFFCEERSSYRPDAARDAWERLRKFFAQYLRA